MATASASNPKSRRKALDVALARWAEALAALRRAADAAGELSDAMAALPPEESDRLDGARVGEDAWHAQWSIESALSLLEGNAPSGVLRDAANPNAA